MQSFPGFNEGLFGKNNRLRERESFGLSAKTSSNVT